jgi:hypothetical protein
MLSCDFLPQILDVPPAPFVFRHAVRRPYFEQGHPFPEGVAPVGSDLAKITMMVQRRKGRKTSKLAGI